MSLDSRQCVSYPTFVRAITQCILRTLQKSQRGNMAGRTSWVNGPENVSKQCYVL